MEYLGEKMPRFWGLVLSCLVIGGPAMAVPSPAETLRGQMRRAGEALLAANAGARIRWRRGTPVLITGLKVPTEPGSPEARARAFVAGQRAVFGPIELGEAKVSSRPGRSVVRFAQAYDGDPVQGRSLVVTIGVDGTIRRIVNDTEPLLSHRPAHIDAQAARALARAHVVPGPVQGIVVGDARPTLLAIRGAAVAGFLVDVGQPPASLVEVWIDAHAGVVLGAHEKVLR